MGHPTSQKSPPTRGPDGRLLPGCAPLNPSGRKPGAERIIRDAVEARGEGWAGLANAMLDMALNPAGKPVDRQRAIEFLYDRVFGRPLITQQNSVTVQSGAGGPQRTAVPSESFGTDRLRAAWAVLQGDSRVIDASSTETPTASVTE